MSLQLQARTLQRGLVPQHEPISQPAPLPDSRELLGGILRESSAGQGSHAVEQPPQAVKQFLDAAKASPAPCRPPDATQDQEAAPAMPRCGSQHLPHEQGLLAANVAARGKTPAAPQQVPREGPGESARVSPDVAQSRQASAAVARSPKPTKLPPPARCDKGGAGSAVDQATRTGVFATRRRSGSGAAAAGAAPPVTGLEYFMQLKGVTRKAAKGQPASAAPAPPAVSHTSSSSLDDRPLTGQVRLGLS